MKPVPPIRTSSGPKCSVCMMREDGGGAYQRWISGGIQTDAKDLVEPREVRHYRISSLVLQGVHSPI
jgi:hypothetical protein